MPKNKRHNAGWSEHEVARMRAHARAGDTSKVSAKKLGRTHGAVKYKAMVEGVRFHAINQPKGPQVRLGRLRRRKGMHATLRRAA